MGCNASAARHQAEDPSAASQVKTEVVQVQPAAQKAAVEKAAVEKAAAEKAAAEEAASLRATAAGKSRPIGCVYGGPIRNDQFTESSNYGNGDTYLHLGRARLNCPHGAWAPNPGRKASRQEWLQVDLGENHFVTGVQTQGSHGWNEMTTEYEVLVGENASDKWHQAIFSKSGSKTFPGNSDQDSIVENSFQKPLYGRFVRFIVKSWGSYLEPAFRVEVLVLSPEEETLKTCKETQEEAEIENNANTVKDKAALPTKSPLPEILLPQVLESSWYIKVRRIVGDLKDVIVNPTDTIRIVKARLRQQAGGPLESKIFKLVFQGRSLDPASTVGEHLQKGSIVDAVILEKEELDVWWEDQRNFEMIKKDDLDDPMSGSKTKKSASVAADASVKVIPIEKGIKVVRDQQLVRVDGPITEPMNLADFPEVAAFVGEGFLHCHKGMSFAATIFREDRPAGFGADSIGRVFSFGNGGDSAANADFTDDIGIRDYPDPKNCTIYAYDGNSCVGHVTSPNLFMPNETSMWLWTVSSAGALKMYKNGAVVGTAQCSRPVAKKARKYLMVGGHNFYKNQFWRGTIRNVRIWNKEVSWEEAMATCSETQEEAAAKEAVAGAVDVEEAATVKAAAEKAAVERATAAGESRPIGCVYGGPIRNDQFTESSNYGNGDTYLHLGRARLNCPHGAWAPNPGRKASRQEWLQVDLGENHFVTGVQTQGSHGWNEMTTEYEVLVGENASDKWHQAIFSKSGSKTFPGNSDQDSIVENSFQKPLYGRFVRFIVKSWGSYLEPAFRVEVLVLSSESPAKSSEVSDGAKSNEKVPSKEPASVAADKCIKVTPKEKQVKVVRDQQLVYVNGPITEPMNLADFPEVAAFVGEGFLHCHNGMSFAATIFREDRPAGFGADSIGRVFSFGNGGDSAANADFTDDIGIRDYPDPKSCTIYAYDGNSCVGHVTSPNLFMPNETSMWLWTVSSAGALKMYKNGDVVGTAQCSRPVAKKARKYLMVGGHNFYKNQFWRGTIRNVRIWNKEVSWEEALKTCKETQEEVERGAKEEAEQKAKEEAVTKDQEEADLKVKAKGNVVKPEILQLAQQGNLMKLKEILQSASVDVDKPTDGGGNTPLQWAIENGHTDCAQLLVEHGADKNQKDSWGYTALHQACDAGRADCVKLLLKNGWDPHVGSKNGTCYDVAGGRGSRGQKQQCIEALNSK